MMGVLRSLVVGLLLTHIPGPAAKAESGDALVRTFATCVGRLSAEMEFRWLVGEPAEDVTRERDAALQILDAISPDVPGTRVLSWRIDAKQAQSALLTRTTFNADDLDRAWARRRADAELAHCRALLLPASPDGSGV